MRFQALVTVLLSTLAVAVVAVAVPNEIEARAVQMPCRGRGFTCNSCTMGQTCCPPLVCTGGICGNPPLDDDY